RPLFVYPMRISRFLAPSGLGKYGEYSSSPDPLRCARVGSHIGGSAGFRRGFAGKSKGRPAIVAAGGRSLAERGFARGRPGGGRVHFGPGPGSHGGPPIGVRSHNAPV